MKMKLQWTYSQCSLEHLDAFRTSIWDTDMLFTSWKHLLHIFAVYLSTQSALKMINYDPYNLLYALPRSLYHTLRGL